MDRRLILLASYLALLPAALLILVACLLISLHRSGAQPQKPTQSYSQIHPQEEVIGVATDARVEALEQFLSRYRSPLLPYSKKIVETADKYSLDWRLLPAIAMQESILCQRIPKNSFNCWGYGIYGGKVKRFTDFNTAIEAISKNLAQTYSANGLNEPHEIVTKYTPANTNNWSGQVSYVMERISSSL